MIIKIEDAVKHYDQFNLNCSLELTEGRVTGLIGQNGAGKTTTFKAILDLIKIDSGKIILFDKDIKDITTEDRCNIGVVLSNSGFSDYLTIKSITQILSAMYKTFDKKDFLQKCNEYSLPIDKKLKDFSNGMKAKLKLLIAMSHDAKLLILDEPTAGLDVIARDDLLDMLRNYMDTDGRSILISSHISSDLESLCDDVYMIDKGQILLHEETNVILDNYGLIKASDTQFETLDKSYILRTRKESYGHSCLTNQKQFYVENYPGLVIEKGNIDEVVTLMIKGTCTVTSL